MVKNHLENSSTFSDIEERIKYNKELAECEVGEKALPNIKVVGERGVIVGLFKFEKNTMEDGGILNPRYLRETSEGGRPSFKLDDFVHQARGKIIKISDEAKKYIEENFPTSGIKEGAIVWLNQQVMNNNYQFIHNREFPVVYAKYLKIHPSTIEAVEINNNENE